MWCRGRGITRFAFKKIPLIVWEKINDFLKGMAAVKKRGGWVLSSLGVSLSGFGDSVEVRSDSQVSGVGK